MPGRSSRAPTQEISDRVRRIVDAFDQSGAPESVTQVHRFLAELRDATGEGDRPRVNDLLSAAETSLGLIPEVPRLAARPLDEWSEERSEQAPSPGSLGSAGGETALNRPPKAQLQNHRLWMTGPG